jgi:hypothetical protein
VGINPILSDLKRPGTSKLEWKYFGHNKIDRNELQICKNSQKGTGTKMAEKLNNFEIFKRKEKHNFQPCSQPRDLLMTVQMP